MSAKKKPSAKKAAPQTAPRSFFFGALLLTALAQVLVLGARSAEGRQPMLHDLVPFLLWALSSALLVLGLKLLRFRGSAPLLAGILLLSGLGVVIRARMSGAVEGVRDMNLLIQPIGFALLFTAALLIRRGRAAALQPFWGLAALTAPALAAAMLALGSRFRGGVYAPGGTTPTELLKLLIPLALAGCLSRSKVWEKRPPWNPPFLPALGLFAFWICLTALLVLLRDLGLVLLLTLTLVAVLITATRRASWGLLALAGLAGSVWAVLNLFSHGARRFEAWLNPFADPTGAGWQVLQALSGIYAGGILGTGFGSGRPGRLPIASSDFVYAVYAEEVGYLGSVLLLLLFAQLFRAGARITRRQSDDFPRLLAAGLTASLVLQTFVNIAGVVNLLPITGITLPYISQGGSSFWVTSLQLGLLLGLSDTKT